MTDINKLTQLKIKIALMWILFYLYSRKLPRQTCCPSDKRYLIENKKCLMMIECYTRLFPQVGY